MKKILVTGGAGFLGSNLCRFLLEEENEVFCLDNFFTGKRENLKTIIGNPLFNVISHDITDTENSLGEKVRESVDEVYNLACPASPIHYQFDPIETIKSNTIGVINVLEFAKLNGARILQASTSEIYGDPLEHPQKETYRGNVNPLGSRACYDEGKRVAETLLSDYNRKFGLPIRIVRIFNTYGPNMHPKDGRVVSNFITQALEKEPITIYGDGNQTRSFCYVSDLISGMHAMMNQDSFAGPVNLGNPSEFSINELARKIIYMVDSSSEIVYKPLPEDDPRQRKPDIGLAKEVLGWEPRVGIEEGLVNTIEYFIGLQSFL